MAQDVEYRYAQPGDVDQIKSFRCRNLGQKWTKWAQEAIREGAEVAAKPRQELDRVLVAVDGAGLVVGVLVFQIGDRGYIRSMGVVEGRRRQGIGTQLKKAALSAIWDVDPNREVYSEVHLGNKPMRGLNDKLGIGHELDPSNGCYYIYSALVDLLEVDPEVDDRTDAET